MTRIYATATDAMFRVDGQAFSGPAVFTWPKGSKHTLEIDLLQYAPSLPRGRYTFQRWSSPVGTLSSQSNIVTISADPGIPWYRADLTVEYAVSLNFFLCQAAPCVSPGTVWVNQAPYLQNTDVYVTAGSTVVLEASPNPGFVFTGWGQSTGLAPIYSFVLNTAVIVYPQFVAARPIQLLTTPDGLQVLADRALVTTPVNLDWGLGTAHGLAAISPQADRQGRQWVFRSWSDGGALDHTFQVGAATAPITLVAQFVPAVPVALLTNATGLKLTVDGVDGIAPRFLTWGPGESHTITAPLHQTDSAGNPWAFREWSTGPAATQTIQVTEAQAGIGIRLTATYDPLSRTRVESAPSGLLLAVDGADCRTPCDLERVVGTLVQISAPGSIGVSDGVRLDFGSWEGADGGSFRATAGYRKVTAHYQWSYLLSLSTTPQHAGSWRLAPSSADGFYPAGSAVAIAIEPESGMKFRQWGKDLEGSANPATLVMDAPHAVQAIMDPVPETPAPAHIGNSAGETPAPTVASGSIASLFGTKLSDMTASTSADPLPQSLAGVTILCSGRLFPLLYVSPQQINFQVPGDLKPGKYRLQVHHEGAATIEVEFEAVRNAPGLFVAVHPDGTPVNSEAPARMGERITLYGTGFGPYQPMPLDGFRIPADRSFVLVDKATVVIQGRNVESDSGIAASGLVGVVVMQVRIPEDLDNSLPGALMVQVGDVSSNTLPLPLK